MSTSPRRRAVRVAAVALAGVALLGACSTATTEQEPAGAPAAESGTIAQTDAEQFKSVVDSGATVVDVRTPAEYAEGHLDGAVNIDLSSPDFATQIGELDPSGTYAVYCRSGNRSAQASQIMAQQGFTTVYDLAGGIAAWSAAGYPVV